jgi:hypothetical protein
MRHLKEGVVALCMNRRELLTSSGAVLGTAALGGCLSRYEDIAGGTGETTTEGEGAETTGEQPTLADASFELLDSGCGQQKNEASVGFEEGDGSVGVTGTITVPSACYVAELADASYDAETGTLEVTVASVEKEGADACAQCLTEIDYEATFAFDDGLPASVRVVHRTMGETETVATTESE